MLAAALLHKDGLGHVFQDLDWVEAKKRPIQEKKEGDGISEERLKEWLLKDIKARIIISRRVAEDIQLDFGRTLTQKTAKGLFEAMESKFKPHITEDDLYDSSGSWENEDEKQQHHDIL